MNNFLRASLIALNAICILIVFFLGFLFFGMGLSWWILSVFWIIAGAPYVTNVIYAIKMRMKISLIVPVNFVFSVGTWQLLSGLAESLARLNESPSANEMANLVGPYWAEHTIPSLMLFIPPLFLINGRFYKSPSIRQLGKI